MFNAGELEFLQRVIKDCYDLGVNLILSGEKGVGFDGDLKSSGYFSEDSPRTLAVSMRYNSWIATLAHEYNHLQQWKENCPVLQKCRDKDGIDKYSEVFEWLDGKRIPLKKVKEYVQSAIDLETDCEERTVDTINKYNLNVNVGDYIQAANAYLSFWQSLPATRKWYDIGKEPYTDPEVLSRYPRHKIIHYKT